VDDSSGSENSDPWEPEESEKGNLSDTGSATEAYSEPSTTPGRGVSASKKLAGARSAKSSNGQKKNRITPARVMMQRSDSALRAHLCECLRVDCPGIVHIFDTTANMEVALISFLWCMCWRGVC